LASIVIILYRIVIAAMQIRYA